MMNLFNHIDLLDPFDPDNRALFEGIQGNILKAHGRHHTANVFIRCYQGEKNAVKAWLHSLVEGHGAIVQSGYAQLRGNVMWKENKIDTGLFACIHISAVGYDYLFGENTNLLFGDKPFRLGMKNANLNDPGSQDWETGLSEDNHFMLLLAHADADALAASLEEVAENITPFGRITAIEKGEALFNEEDAGIEHFGYVDGVSQPLFFEDEWETYKANNNIQSPADIRFDPRAAKELVLVQDPLIPEDPNARGSYFVFRKLEQNVKGFKLAEGKLADELKLSGEDRERVGAMLVGRFEDGTPVEISPEEGLIHSAVINNFDYEPLDGSRCPFHGHIRKTNPRSGVTGGIPEAKRHIMARRGIPFGTRTDGPNDGHLYNKPENGVGLLFMSYQTSIETQFEFIQKNWVNDPRFPNGNPSNPDGIDPIIGQGKPVAGDLATEWGMPKSLSEVDFGQFVHLKGGEYFFAPSMSFLKLIHSQLL